MSTSTRTSIYKVYSDGNSGSLNGKRVKKNRRTTDNSPLALFFSQHLPFKYNPARSATDEFYRLCDFNGWDRDDEDRQIAKRDFQDALTIQFNDSYGTDENDIINWQALCARLGIDPIPDSLRECRQAVRKTHVNLVDLVDIFDAQGEVHVFSTVVELSEYTKSTGKFFPRYNAHAGNLLKFLLRQIMDPGCSKKKGGSSRGRRGGR